MKQKKMFKILIIIMFCFAANNLMAQDITASTIKIGPFYIDMKQSEVESVILKKLSSKDLKVSYEDFNKDIIVTVNSTKFKLGFATEYDDKGEPNGKYRISRVHCEDKNVKTKSGIKVGMAKTEVMTILDRLKIGYSYYKSLKYTNEGKLTNSFIEYFNIFDEKAGKNLTVELKNGEVIAFSLSYAEDGC
jgi:hypothetical protein